MVAGHLHEKNGYYYIILNLTDSAGKRKPKWISTGLTIKGNKKRAEQMLMEERRKYTNAKAGDDVLFADFMEQWLEIVKSTVSVPTYSSYVNAVKSIIAPYFRKKKILLRDLQAHDIQMFYQEQLQRVKPATMLILLSHKSGPRNYLLSALLSYHSSPINAKNAVMTTKDFFVQVQLSVNTPTS